MREQDSSYTTCMLAPVTYNVYLGTHSRQQLARKEEGTSQKALNSVGMFDILILTRLIHSPFLHNLLTTAYEIETKGQAHRRGLLGPLLVGETPHFQLGTHSKE